MYSSNVYLSVRVKNISSRFGYRFGFSAACVVVSCAPSCEKLIFNQVHQ